MMQEAYCASPARRELVREKGLNGIDYVEVAPSLTRLFVYFLGPVPEGLAAFNLQISGGTRVRGLRVTSVSVETGGDEREDGRLVVELDRVGDASSYRLCLVEPELDERGQALLDEEGHPKERPLSGFDPRYACLEFSLHAACASLLDCRPEDACPSPPRPAVAIDYLAKDYASLRRLILDRLALTLPAWTERHVPDLGIALVELLAYAGDHLSYFQDAVATEAYLDTARRRISVKRHARLVDYALHEGCNARAWVCVETSRAFSLRADQAMFVVGTKDDAGGLLDDAQLARRFEGSSYQVFEPVQRAELHFSPDRNAISFYTWGDRDCCLPRGATHATLAEPEGAASDQPPSALRGGTGASLGLEQGDALIFEEILGPRTGNTADADPTHRHVVRLTRVTRSVDSLTGRRVLDVEWGLEDALPFPFCLSVIGPAPACAYLEDVSIARGNVVLVDHGATLPPDLLGIPPLEESAPECDCVGLPSATSPRPGRFEPVLAHGPVTFREAPSAEASAAGATVQDPRRALPEITLKSRAFRRAAASGGEGRLEWGEPAVWEPRQDLLDSGPTDRAFVVEVDDEARAHLRFGDGRQGRLAASDFQLVTSTDPSWLEGAPELDDLAGDHGTYFAATYRVGCGSAGNVGAEAIRYLVTRGTRIDGVSLRVRNPLPARGGIDPEAVATAKLRAPHAIGGRLERAVTSDDYARLTERELPNDVQGASARLRWNGSWYETRVAVDARSSSEANPALLARVEAALHPYRRMLHDLTVVGARQVPLDVSLVICVLPHYERGHVRQELLRVLGTGELPGGGLGLFHPDRLRFGEDVFLSQIVATARAAAGVEHVHVKRLQRLNEPSNAELESGVLRLGPNEIARLDNSASFPENGRLELRLEGGR